MRTSRAVTADIETPSARSPAGAPVSSPVSAPGASSPSRLRTRGEFGPFLLFVSLLVLLRSVIIDWSQVPTGSMSPTIAVGDHIVVDKRAYDLRVPFTHLSLWRHAAPERGDIVAFNSPADGTLYVKRVIGLPGDTVALHGDVLVINGQAAQFEARAGTEGRLAIEELVGGHRHLIRLAGGLPGSRAGNPTGDGIGSAGFGPLTVPPEAYLLMGDNRRESFDSRHFGFVDRNRILGRAVSVAFSLDCDRAFAPRPERTLIPLQ